MSVCQRRLDLRIPCGLFVATFPIARRVWDISRHRSLDPSNHSDGSAAALRRRFGERLLLIRGAQASFTDQEEKGRFDFGGGG
jgi:hypothetical protein